MPESLPAEFERFSADLCTNLLLKLPVTGVALSTFSGPVPETSIFSSDATSARIVELQFDLGEGPRWQALRTRRPVLVSNIILETQPNWPVFCKAILDYNVAAIFVFPLYVGAVEVGVIELYSSTSGPFSAADYSLARQLSNAAAWHLLRRILDLPVNNADSAEPKEEPLRVSQRVVHQATGMVLAQTGESATNALLLLRAHAFSQGRTVREVSSDVVSRKLNFLNQQGDDLSVS